MTDVATVPTIPMVGIPQLRKRPLADRSATVYLAASCFVPSTVVMSRLLRREQL
jgi:hypothetical protein